jgi:hypothetical protein
MKTPTVGEAKAQYYFYMYKRKPVAVFRSYKKDGRLKFERWVGSRWVNSPELCFVTGYSATIHYVPATEKEALNFLHESSFV